jgi:hypothetical protein
MMVCDRFKTAKLADLEIEVSALFLIAAPSTPEPVRQEVIRHAQINTDNITHSAVKDVVVEYNKTGDAPAAVAKIFDAVRQSRKEAEQLPSSAEARRIAIETGKHTLDRRGTYQPPMTVKEQDEWQADMMRLEPLAQFFRWVKEEAGAANELVEIIEMRHWRTRFNQPVEPAITWLKQFERARCEREGSQKK